MKAVRIRSVIISQSSSCRGRFLFSGTVVFSGCRTPFFLYEKKDQSHATRKMHCQRIRSEKIKNRIDTCGHGNGSEEELYRTDWWIEEVDNERILAAREGAGFVFFKRSAIFLTECRNCEAVPDGHKPACLPKYRETAHMWTFRAKFVRATLFLGVHFCVRLLWKPSSSVRSSSLQLDSLLFDRLRTPSLMCANSKFDSTHTDGQ